MKTLTAQAKALPNKKNPKKYRAATMRRPEQKIFVNNRG